MGRMDRIRTELAATVRKLSAAIEKSHTEGKIPADYSLGFANGVIFFEHMLSQNAGQPRFFDRTSSIGTLPIPIALREKDQVEKEYNAIAGHARRQEEIFLNDQIIVQARGVVESIEQMEREGEDPKPQTVRGFSLGLAAMKKAIDELDRTITQHQELVHAKEEHQANLEKAAQSEPIRICPTQADDVESKGDGELRASEVDAGERPSEETEPPRAPETEGLNVE